MPKKAPKRGPPSDVPSKKKCAPPLPLLTPFMYREYQDTQERLRKAEEDKAALQRKLDDVVKERDQLARERWFALMDALVEPAVHFVGGMSCLID